MTEHDKLQTVQALQDVQREDTLQDDSFKEANSYEHMYQHHEGCCHHHAEGHICCGHHHNKKGA